MSKSIYCIGDSFTYGLEGFDDAGLTIPMKPFSDMLAVLMPDWTVENRGTGGWTLGNIRTDWVSYCTTDERRQGIVICGGGTNNQNSDPADMLTIQDEIMATLDPAFGRLLLWGPFGRSGMSDAQKGNLAGMRKNYRDKYPYVDMWDFHCNADGWVNSDYRRYNTGGGQDSFHPNIAFYTEVANRMQAKILDLGWDNPQAFTRRWRPWEARNA